MTDLSSYRLFRVGNRPLLAFPAGPRAGRLRSAGLLRADTPARRLLRAILTTIVYCGADRLLFRPAADAGLRLPDLDLDSLLQEASAHVRAEELWAVLMWPPDPARGRIYVLLTAPDGLEAFVKVGFSPFDAARLENETHMLRALGEMDDRPFHVPEVLFARRENESLCWLAIKALAESAGLRSRKEANEPGEVLRFLAEHSPAGVGDRPAADCPWYRGYQVDPGGSGRVREVLGAAPSFRTGWAHGDLGPGNMLVTGKDTWLIDWENASFCAPHLTDRVCYWLSLRQRRILRNPARYAGELARAFSERAETDVVAALAFLDRRHNRSAGAILEHWEGMPA
jgi:hypothetical protein